MELGGYCRMRDLAEAPKTESSLVCHECNPVLVPFTMCNVKYSMNMEGHGF